MKITTKLFGHIALVVVIGLSMTALSLTGCDLNPTGEDGVIPGNSGSTKEVVKEVYTYSANGELGGYQICEYDTKGNLMKISGYNTSGDLISYDEFEYDPKGNQTKMNSYNTSIIQEVGYWMLI